MKNYDHQKIESKWQKVWEKNKPDQVNEGKGKPKFYGLIEFPYPSGEGLHVGHVRSNTAMDIIARKRRREGFNVLYPIGWDAFGLPTENYAIKTGVQPAVVTKKNINTFRRQLKALGFSFDWSREVDTSDPKYYKWTQWIFLQFLKKGLAYKKKMEINWCPKDLIGLANEEVINGCCERCGTKVERKEKEQWMLAITKYADRLDKDLDETEFLEKIKIQQRNWIGKSEGSELWFNIKKSEEKIRVFTTRPDTLFGVTYLVLAPEGDLVQKLKPLITNWKNIEKFIEGLKSKTEIERTAENKEKNGIRLEGIEAKHPLTKEILPVYIADYVLANYGTGAVMAVPAHDQRDFEFATKYNLPIRQVIVEVKKDYTPLCTIRNDKKIVNRNSVVCIIKHWSEEKYLCLNWKKVNWHTPLTGGIDDGETPEETGAREIKEESGYQNFKFLGRGLDIIGSYYNPVKDVNRFEKQTPLFFELINDEQGEVSSEEKEKHELVWVEKNKVEKYLNHDEKNFDARVALHVWSQYLTPSAITNGGVLINSGSFDGLDSEEAKKKITEAAGGVQKTTYKLKDWVFSRQRYWGEPIPVIHCQKCGVVPVPEKDLPLKLPKVKNYKPTKNGESPLALVSKWVNVKCPKCKGSAKRETDTMPNWAGSSWYYLRYADPKNNKAFADQKNLKYWTPVDWYNGGMEHTTLHLLYSRFWHKFLYDLNLVPTKEPYKKRTSHGLILAEGGEKMSKSKGNVINPDGIVKLVGADTLRLHEMFMGPFDQAIAWDSGSIAGSRRFLDRIWKLQEKVNLSDSLNEKHEMAVHKTTKKVSEDIEEMRFNTAISSMMILLNEFEKEKEISKNEYGTLLKLLAPFTPHITEELWLNLGYTKSIHLEKWPEFDSQKIISQNTTIVVQINGKARANFEIASSSTQVEVEKVALSLPEVSKWLIDKEIKKTMFIKGKILSIITN